MAKKIHNSYFSPTVTNSSTIPMFFIISFTAILCLIYTNTTLIFNLSQNLETLIIDKTNLCVPKNINNNLQYPIIVPTEEKEEVDREFAESLILPSNITNKEERIAWYQRKLPQADFFKSDELALKFHGRVSEFLNQNCSVQFFVTWFAPAKDFGKRVFFTMESIFKNHPNGCLVIISRTMDTKLGYRTLKPLIDQGFMILAVTPNVHFLVKNTPAEDWMRRLVAGTRDPGNIPLPQNLSNLLRLAILYKYGGVYLDTDYVILQDFLRLRNVIGAQSVDPNKKKWTRLNNAALVFDVGHPILYDFLEEFAKTFNGYRWGYNGPYLVSRVVERIMSTLGLGQSNKTEYNITVLPPKAFYPVDWIEIPRFLKKPVSKWIVGNEIKALNDGETYGIHLWNSRIKGLKIERGSVLARLISQHCIVCEDI